MQKNMKKKSYMTPETQVCLLDTQSSILALSASDTPASKDATVLTNEDEFVDIWDL